MKTKEQLIEEKIAMQETIAALEIQSTATRKALFDALRKIRKVEKDLEIVEKLNGWNYARFTREHERYCTENDKVRELEDELESNHSAAREEINSLEYDLSETREELEELKKTKEQHQ